MLKTMVSFWWKTHGQNVPQAQLRRVPQTPREKVMAMVPRGTLCWEGKATVLGPSLAQHWNSCSHDQTQRGSHQLGLEAGPRLNQAIAPHGCAASSDTSYQLGCHTGVGGRRKRDFWLGTWAKSLTKLNFACGGKAKNCRSVAHHRVQTGSQAASWLTVYYTHLSHQRLPTETSYFMYFKNKNKCW